MNNTLTQNLTQEQRLQQTISQQQLLQSQLAEMPLEHLLERVNDELNDNPALEQGSDELHLPGDATPDNTPTDSAADDISTHGSADETDTFDAELDRADRRDALDMALEGIGRDDEDLPVYSGGRQQADDDRDEMVYGQDTSFIDTLEQQAGELELDQRQRYIMDYLIGSLDADGLLRTSNAAICDDLALYHSIECSEQEVEQMVGLLQRFDPAGIGTRSLKECLQVQAQRRLTATKTGDRQQRQLLRLVLEVVENHFDDFAHNRWQTISRSMQLTEAQTEQVQHELLRLNPKPGAAMGETVGRSMDGVTPDFTVYVHDDQTITFHINDDELPQLQVSQTFADMLRQYRDNRQSMTRQAKEALLYARTKVAAAQGFIDALRQRHRSMTLTMQAIIDLQRPFFIYGDEASLRPMTLRDVAAKTGLDLSTISRVCRGKYADTPWGLFPLRHFFASGVANEQGEELSNRHIKAALRELIDHEDKRHPLSDEALSQLLQQQGLPVARRTVAKYRIVMGIPSTRLRR
ncbi:MAG: RNA polymerase factor sigma-54 [Prevotella sp.]|nr:RNA polymerase factor sigma-54 [Prevotella sp.]